MFVAQTYVDRPAARGNTLTPSVDSWVEGTTTSIVEAERSLCRGGIMSDMRVRLPCMQCHNAFFLAEIKPWQ